MAPTNLENDFNKKLNRRSIAPSATAWDTLSERLEAQEVAVPSSRNYWKHRIAAASIILVCMVGPLFYKYSKGDVSVKAQANQTITPQATDLVPSLVTTKKPSDTLASTKQGTSPSKVATTPSFSKDKPSQNLKLKATKVHEVIDNSSSTDVVVAETPFTSAKAEEVANAIYSITKTTSKITETTIDSLLRAAQNEILEHKMQAEGHAVVDATALLQGVELELDASFRDKVFKVLKARYGSVKTAITRRND